METKLFHISDILSVTTGRLLSKYDLHGVADIQEFMTNGKIEHPLSDFWINKCKVSLLKQFPQFDSPEMHFAIGELILMLDLPINNTDKKRKFIIIGWISKLICGGYGIDCEKMSNEYEDCFLEVEKILDEGS